MSEAIINAIKTFKGEELKRITIDDIMTDESVKEFETYKKLKTIVDEFIIITSYYIMYYYLLLRFLLLHCYYIIIAYCRIAWAVV